MRSLIAALAVFLSFSSAYGGELVTKISPHSVDATMARLEAAVEAAGAKVFAKVDHAAGAASIGNTLPDNQVLIFGNPRIGTPVMAYNGAAGLDLPLRIAIFTGEDARTRVVYRNPTHLVVDHGIPANLPALAMMTTALDNLTNAAIAE